MQFPKTAPIALAAIAQITVSAFTSECVICQQETVYMPEILKVETIAYSSVEKKPNNQSAKEPVQKSNWQDRTFFSRSQESKSSSAAVHLSKDNSQKLSIRIFDDSVIDVMPHSHADKFYA